MQYVVGIWVDDDKVFLVDYIITPVKHYHRTGNIDNAVVFDSSILASQVARVFNMDVFFYGKGE